jgi:thiol-disulfide isomerase/thioredoxin
MATAEDNGSQSDHHNLAPADVTSNAALRSSAAPKVIITIAALFMLSLAALALWIGQSATPSAKPKEVDASAGIIYTSSFPDIGGKTQSLGQWQHKLLIINFWATWCAPCKEEMPVFARLQKKYADNGLQIVGIAADSSLNVVNFDKNMPGGSIGYPLLPDEVRAIEFSKRLGNRLGLLPYTVIVRPGGEVIKTQIGIISEAEFEAIIRQNMPKKH